MHLFPLFACLVPLLMPGLMVLGGLAGGAGWFVVPLLVFGLVPLGDWLLGPARPEALNAAGRLPDRAFLWLLRAWVPIQAAMLLWGAATVSGLNPSAQIGLTLSVGILSGATGIILAHELMHRPGRLDRLLSQALLLMVCYLQFYIEHLRGHHRNVAIPGDPATSRLGESLYRFYPRALASCWRSAWSIELARLARKGHARWSPRNRMLWYAALPLGLAAALGWVWGPMAVGFFFVQSLIAFSLLEASNYIEHYGLSRRELRPGVYEPVTMAHSWNADRLLSGCLMFMLQRHSDHHAHPARPYQRLVDHPTGPRLPAGFATMLLLAMVPPLWHRIMDPLARQAMGTGENLSPAPKSLPHESAAMPPEDVAREQDHSVLLANRVN